MKKSLWLIGLSVLAAHAGLKSAIAQTSGDFYNSLLISDEIKNEENAQQAKQNAGKLLDTKPAEIKIDSPLLRSQQKKLKRAKKSQEFKARSKIIRGNEAAPFGLAWGASYDEVKKDGVTLSPVGQKDYVNNFSATHLPKKVSTFREVILTFGIENELWRIIAYGNLINDTPSAEKVMEIYNRYYRLLEQKYGNAQQFYTPKVINVDTQVPGSNSQKTETIAQEQPIGNPDFLSELQNGEAFLYATFENGKVGAALSVNVDGSGQSYITIEYKNLTILQAREKSTLDAL